jgi:protein-S-isoprenylcysteine O-methyltransferase Ste14
MFPVVDILIILWVSSEVFLGLARRADPNQARVSDQGSGRLLWTVIVVAVAVAVALRNIHWGRLPFPIAALEVLATLFLLAGIGLRWWAILTLGSSFTTNVAVAPEQEVLSSGPYRWIRHPAYAGIVMAFFGCGWHLGSWLSLATLILPVWGAILNRVKVEEEALLEVLGKEYRDYRLHTKVLIPWIF